jgi:hypothetical protein
VSHPKSQSHNPALIDALQAMNGVSDGLRKAAKDAQYLRILQSQSILKDYRDGRCALVLDVPISFPGNEMRPVTFNGNTASLVEFALFIFHSDASQHGYLNRWNQEPVLIENVQSVKSIEGIIPTTVRTYVGNCAPKKHRSNGVYFSFFQRSFKELFGRVDWEFCFANLRGNESADYFYPRIIERGLQIVNRVPTTSDGGCRSSRISRLRAAWNPAHLRCGKCERFQPTISLVRQSITLTR